MTENGTFISNCTDVSSSPLHRRAGRPSSKRQQPHYFLGKTFRTGGSVVEIRVRHQEHSLRCAPTATASYSGSICLRALGMKSLRGILRTFYR